MKLYVIVSALVINATYNASTEMYISIAAKTTSRWMVPHELAVHVEDVEKSCFVASYWI